MNNLTSYIQITDMSPHTGTYRLQIYDKTRKKYQTFTKKDATAIIYQPEWKYHSHCPLVRKPLHRNCQKATAAAAATLSESTPWDIGIRTT